MVSILYSVAAFTCSLIAVILPGKIATRLKEGNKIGKAFLVLIRWTAIFCAADGLWGIMAGELIMSDSLLFVMSCVFHIMAAITPAVWLYFVIIYLDDGDRARGYQALTCVIIITELILIIMNIFNRKMFYVDESGIYCSAPLRRLLFYMQYATYVAIGIISAVNLVREKIEVQNDKSETIEHNYRAVMLFVASPIFCGIFQMLYPDAPAYSIGYTLGVCVIYSFVLTGMLHEQYVESAKVEAVSQYKTEFLFNMSHDIRTPMNAILGYTDMGLRHCDDAQLVKSNFKKIKTAGEHLLNLVNDILEISRIEAGKVVLTEETLDLREAISSSAEICRNLAKAKNIDFIVSTEEIKNPFVYADKLHLNEVMINLISNAIKYTTEGGKVSFIGRQTGDMDNQRALYEIEVTDNGIGMSEELQAHLFEEFSREKSADVAKIEGTGLGLSIVKSIVDLAGGSIHVKSRLNEGSTFLVDCSLKVMTDEEIKEYKLQLSQSEETLKTDKVLEGKRILLAEDNEMNREIATDILSEVGFIVETAENGKIAVEMVKQKDVGYYDFILMDIQMPIMNGYDATREIRKLPNGGDVPIIALSANAFTEDRETSINAGMNDHVAKPIDIKILLATIKQYL